ncbi:MAG: hypothetical protein JJ974_02945 [Phycisphaerales bacterium]|nr:hypothetical protein [Phycisphaerales bacterium]
MTTTPSKITREQTNAQELRFQPAIDQWARAFDPPRAQPLIQARTQLGLPVDVPIIASGHQPTVFHPGIIAKLIALDQLAKISGAHRLWIVPDQDIVDPALIRMPHGSGNDLEVRELRLGGSTVVAPAALTAPIEMDPDLPQELESLAQWISGYEHEDSLAKQFSSAIIAMICEQLDLDQPTILYASELMDSVGSELLDPMLDDPKSAIRAYNTAAERYPDAGVRPLSIDTSRIELPFWRLGSDSRSEVFVDPTHPHELDRSRLAPRGLAMTAIMRLLLCECFIHGTGGYLYDQITTDWIQDWLGQPLAPIVGASADVYLDLELPETPSVDHAVWRAHHARHTPAMLSDPAADAQKRELVGSIQDAKDLGDRPLAARRFRELQDLLGRVRKQHAQELEALDQAVEMARSSQHLLDLARDRTWAFPLYTDQQLEQLKASIVDAF